MKKTTKKIIYCDIDHSGLDLDNIVLNERIWEIKWDKKKLSRREIKENMVVKQKAMNAYMQSFFTGMM